MTVRSPSPVRLERPVLRRQAAGAPRHRYSKSAAIVTLILFSAFALFTVGFEPAGWPLLDHDAPGIAAWLADGPIGSVLAYVYLLGVPSVSLVLGAVLAVFVLVLRGWRAALLALGTLGLMAAVEGSLRIRVAALPWSDPLSLLAQRHVWHLVDSTYPSGHTARVLATAGMAACLLPRRSVSAGIIATLLLGGLMAVQRVSSGQHTGSDVLGGFLLGVGMAAFFAALLPGLREGRGQ